MITLSKRLSCLAGMVSQGAVLADIGTDHGYIPIDLVQSGRICRAFAMDIGKGPLLRAKGHITACGLEEYITLRLSDGVSGLVPGEADAILIAGMGGGVTLHILKEGRAVVAAANELILQPQSEIEKVRAYLLQSGYAIDRERIVFEDGKYYPMFHVDLHTAREDFARYSDRDWQMICRYGKVWRNEDPKVLRQYLLHMAAQYEAILERLSAQPSSEAIRVRREEILDDLACVQHTLGYRKEE